MAKYGVEYREKGDPQVYGEYFEAESRAGAAEACQSKYPDCKVLLIRAAKPTKAAATKAADSRRKT